MRYICYSYDLRHSGIKGMHWGIRRYQNYDGSLTPEGRKRYGITRRDRIQNIDKWGTSPKTNMLIVTGLSGSGKSTLANKLSKEHNADVISLDHYYDNPFHPEYQSKGFNRYLSKNVPEYSKIKKNFEEYDRVRFGQNLTGRDRKLQKEYWSTMDKVRDAMYGYSESMYGKRKVISEGIQWMDSTLFDSKEKRNAATKNSPVIVKTTSNITSSIRGTIRDSEKVSDYGRQFAQKIKFNRNLQRY